MPEFSITGRTIPYASEEEVLAFANRLRELGGADPIEALFPSEPENEDECLIANALNFQCSIEPCDGTNEDYWVMRFPDNMDANRAKQIAEGMNCELYECKGHFSTNFNIKLPRLIGNAAAAFDNEEGWTSKYVAWPE